MRHYRQKNNVKNGAYALFQQLITFKQLIQFSKTKVFWNQLTNLFLFLTICFIYAILIIYNPFKLPIFASKKLIKFLLIELAAYKDNANKARIKK